MAIRTDDELHPEPGDDEESRLQRRESLPAGPPSIAHYGDRDDLKDRAFVYEWPVRAWHWVMTLTVIALVITGLLIAHPLSATTGEAFDHHRMAWVRTIHFSAAWVFALTMVGRIYWAFVGNDHARQIFFLPVWKKAFWQQLWHEMRWYAFLEKRPDKHVGHNPLARVAMNIMFLGGTLVVMLTGFALYGEELGRTSWAYTLFGWVVDLFGGTQQVRSVHHMAMWVLIVFTLSHVYAVFREDIMGRQSTVSTMINGWRFFRDGPDDIGEDH